MRYTDHIPTTNKEVLSKLECWFRKRPEILVRTRVRCSGREEFEFFSSFKAFEDTLRESLPGTWFTVFEQPQLPLRGIVDNKFIARCLDIIPDGAEYLMMETVRTAAGKMSWFRNHSDDTHVMFRSDIEGSLGVSVAVGLYPPCLEERDDVIHVFTPNADGIVKAGPY
jgi:hypothetical protein